ncbi:hypothetical protein [Chromobacterium violaceum]|uniref:hypothetical protein n=1 Tax=Chromobacterium violaceum TaxID=536 RepID=UPI00111BD229|nr:hypothetical protein [Chromobacterium violaceum]
MIITEFVNLTIKEMGGAAVIIAGLSVWLGKRWEARISLHEKSKIDVQIKYMEALHARKTQSLEHELLIARNAAQLGHAKLIEKRAALIDDSYKFLVELHEAIFDIFRPDFFGRKKPKMPEAYEITLLKFDDFVINFEKNKIYFSPDVAKKISEFYVKAALAIDQARVAIQSGESLGCGETPQLVELFNKVNYEMMEARKIIEDDFRGILRTNEI